MPVVPVYTLYTSTRLFLSTHFSTFPPFHFSTPNGRDARCPSLLVAFVKEAIRAAVAAIMGVAGAALSGCTAVTAPADASHTIGVVGFGVPFGIQVNK